MNNSHLNIASRLTVFVIAVFFLSGTCSAYETPKKRIISLTPASTEILFGLGLGDKVVGVSSFCNWPEDARLKQKVGSFSSPDIEKIIMLRPDLVILTGMEQEQFKSVLRNLKIDYIIVDPANLNELFLSIEKIGEATAAQKEAKAMIAGIEDRISYIRSKLSGPNARPRPKVYLEIWYDPVMSCGKRSFVSDMIEKSGGINITNDLRRSYSVINPELIILRNPDIIITTYMKPAPEIERAVLSRIGWSDINAVKNKKIFSDINPDVILRPGPRVGDGLIELYKRFYEN